MDVRFKQAPIWPVLGAWLLLVATWFGYAAVCCLILHVIGVWWLPWWLGFTPVALAIAAGWMGWSDKTVPATVTPADDHEDARLYAVVERVAALFGRDVPSMMVIETDAPNSVVLEPDDAARPTLYVSRGLLERLDNEQLQTVVAHEFAHMTHRDAKVLAFARGTAMWVVVLPTLLFVAISYLEVPCCIVARCCGRPWSSSSERITEADLKEHPPRRRLPLMLAVPLLVAAWLVRVAVWIVLLTVGVAMLLAGFVLMLPGFAAANRLARRRELAADRAAADMTGAPATLAAALGTIEGGMHTAPSADLRSLASMSPLAIVPFARPAEEGHDDWMDRRLAWANRTHPPMHRRMDQLARLSRRMGAGASR
ncbi:M48 family metalloprotease [Phytoactinopolyspora halotolerans]|uniref:M48 family metalloprotease n=1 Tax=Phytoactinopolyspora halotolerans TaxID=1981512 RepID=A0A6L9SGG3_9ACTN|nr:M48 family metalloprotease [Phytoactinopolyspora halotolerans]NEE04465.1 M48 family metalloprotease [Phytoactinopolyspora halotolerans]